MTRPGNNILQFASRSSGRGKTERVGGGCEQMRALQTGQGQGLTANGGKNQFARSCVNTADSLWSSAHINAHKRKNGTFVNGPEAMDSIARGVILGVLLATLVGMGFWLCRGFSQAETAIIHRLGK